MFVRFQGLRRNDGSATRLGVFQLAFELRDRFDLPDYALAQLQIHLGWLRLHLKSPEILDEDEHHRAICWFDSRAAKPIAHVRGLKAVLDDWGYPIEMVKTRDPGIIIYRDGWQVVAKPRRSRPAGRHPAIGVQWKRGKSDSNAEAGARSCRQDSGSGSWP